MEASSKSNFKFLPLGAIIQEFRVNQQNIVQNFPTAELYKNYNQPYFGETIGRVACRISGAKINLNGRSYPLAANDGSNSLHGGNLGWGKKDFEGPFNVTRNGKDALLFKYLSKNGEEGYPGTVELRIWYSEDVEHQGNVDVVILEAEYEAEMVGDEDIEETAVAVTNHRYFQHQNSLYFTLLTNCVLIATSI
jgi:aldose 1-epimerase